MAGTSPMRPEEWDDAPWLKAYPGHLPAELTPRHGHMLDHWRDAVDKARDREAIRYFDASLDYGRVDQLSDGLARWLTGQGVGAGDHVGILLQNVPAFPIAVLAAWKVGAVPVPCNPMYRVNELAALFADFGPAAIVVESGQRIDVEQALGRAGLSGVVQIEVQPSDLGGGLDRRAVPADGPAPLVSFIAACETGGPPVTDTARLPEDLALILYTSGTSGEPKGAMIHHRSLCFSAEASALWTGLDADSRVLALAPYFHITGFALHMSVAIVAHASVGMMYRFEPGAVLAFARVYRPTFTIAAITAFNALSGQPDATPADFASLTGAFSGGAPIAPPLRKRIHQTLGLLLQPVYGMTETCSATHIAPQGMAVPVDPATGSLSVGLPVSSTAMRIMGTEGAAPPGEPGEIWLRGPQLMSGYWNRPDQTGEVMVDGWLRTGDVGFVDQNGWLYVIDRQKDMINVSGFKVWPRQVEDALLSHPAVREAAVIGEPDAYRGETVVAYISVRDGITVDEETIRAHCRTLLAAYKVPRRVEMLAEVPKTITGKIRRATLRAS